MKAWLVPECVGFGSGLGKMDIIIIPRPNNNSLIVKITRDGRVWIDCEKESRPNWNEGFCDIEIDDELVEAVNNSFDNEDKGLTEEIENSFIDLVNKILSL